MNVFHIAFTLRHNFARKAGEKAPQAKGRMHSSTASLYENHPKIFGG